MIVIERPTKCICSKCGNKVKFTSIDFETNCLVTVSCQCSCCGFIGTGIMMDDGIVVRKEVPKKRLFGLLKPKIEFQYKYIAKIKDE